MRDSLLDDIAAARGRNLAASNRSQSRVQGVISSIGEDRKTAEVLLYETELVRLDLSPGDYKVGDIVVVSIDPVSGRPIEVLYSTGEAYTDGEVPIGTPTEDYDPLTPGTELWIDPRDDGLPPPTPGVFDLTTDLGIIVVSINNYVKPADFSHFNVAASYDPVPFEVTGQMWGVPDSVALPGFKYGQEVFVRIMAVDLFGEESDWSLTMSIVPKPLVDADIVLEHIDAAKVLIENAGNILLEDGKKLDEKLAQFGDVDLSLDELEASMDELSDVILPGLTQRLSSAETVLGPLSGAVEAAQSAANAAAGQASTAQQAAADAAEAALQAVGVAAGKGQVIVQLSAPTGARAAVENLWVRLPDLKVHIYDAVEAKWIAATDPDLIAAAEAVVTAQQAAEAAQQAADTANERAEALEGQVGTLQTDLATAKGRIDAVQDDTLPALSGELETLRDTTIPDLTAIVGPLPQQIADAQERADAAHTDLTALAGTVAGKSSLHYGDTAPSDFNALWIKNGVPHIYVEHEGAEGWLNRDTGLANWTPGSDDDSTSYAEGVWRIDLPEAAHSRYIRSPLIPNDGASSIKHAILIHPIGSAEGREGPRVYRQSRYFDADGNSVENTSGYTGNGNAAFAEDEFHWNSWTMATGPDVAFVQVDVTIGSGWTGPTAIIAGSTFVQSSDPNWNEESFDGETPGFKWDGERYASTSSYAGPGWYAVTDPEVREAAARAQAARDRAEAIAGTVGTLETDLAESAGIVTNLRDVTLPGLTTRLEGAEYDIKNFDAEWITAGTLDTDRLNANSVAAAVGDFLRLNAEQITAGLIQGDQINATSIASAVAEFLALSAGQITSGTISTERLDFGAIAGGVADIITINAEQITSGLVQADQINTTGLAASIATIIQLDAARITSGVIRTDQLDAVSVAAVTAEFMNITADKIYAVGAGFQSAVIDEIYATAVKTKLLTVTDKIITPDIIADNAVTARMIVASEEMWAKTLGAHKITSVELDVNELRASEAFIGALRTGILTVGSVPATAVQDLPATKITSGTLSSLRIPTLPQSKVSGLPAKITAYDVIEGRVSGWTTPGQTTINGGRIETNSIKSDQIDVLSLRAAIITSDAFLGKEFIGGTFTGSVFRTGSSGARWQLDPTNGLRAWNVGGDTVLRGDSDGNLVIQRASVENGGNLTIDGGRLLFRRLGAETPGSLFATVDDSSGRTVLRMVPPTSAAGTNDTVFVLEGRSSGSAGQVYLTSEDQISLTAKGHLFVNAGEDLFFNGTTGFGLQAGAHRVHTAGNDLYFAAPNRVGVTGGDFYVWNDVTSTHTIRGAAFASLGNGAISVPGGVNSGGQFVNEGNGFIYGDLTVSARTFTDQVGRNFAPIYFEDIGGGRIRQPTVRSTSTTANANVFVGSNGVLALSTSTRRAKVAIDHTEIEHARKVLEIEPRTWFDRGDAERYAQYIDRTHAFGPEPNPEELTTVEPLHRIPGVIAEEVEEAGLIEFVIYDDEGEVIGVNERLWTLLLPLVKEQDARITSQDARITSLEAQLREMKA